MTTGGPPVWGTIIEIRFPPVTICGDHSTPPRMRQRILPHARELCSQPPLPDMEGCAPPSPPAPPVPAADAREMKTPRSAEAVLKRRAESYVPPSV